jgi:hypothetical protein
LPSSSNPDDQAAAVLRQPIIAGEQMQGLADGLRKAAKVPASQE